MSAKSNDQEKIKITTVTDLEGPGKTEEDSRYRCLRTTLTPIHSTIGKKKGQTLSTGNPEFLTDSPVLQTDYYQSDYRTNSNLQITPSMMARPNQPNSLESTRSQ